MSTNEIDRERLRQATVRQVVSDPRPTLGQRLRGLGMRAGEAARAVGRWASRNAEPRQVQVNVNQPTTTAEARPTAARTFPTDGGLTPNQRLETIANDVAGQRAEAQPPHTPWHQTEQGRAIHEKYAQARQEEVRGKQPAGEREQDRQERIKEQHHAWQREQKAQTTKPAAQATRETTARGTEKPAPREGPETTAQGREKFDQEVHDKKQTQTTSPAERFGRKEYGRQPQAPEDTPTKKGPQPKP
jgi:hypothetical protein